jgi:hypothetical protein
MPGEGGVMRWVWTLLLLSIGCSRPDDTTLADPPNEEPEKLLGGAEPLPVPAPSVESEGGRSRSGTPCPNDGARLSLMAIGIADCAVSVGGRNIGRSPLVWICVPSGEHEVRVVCPDGRHYETTKTFTPFRDEKIIIKPDMYRR